MTRRMRPAAIALSLLGTLLVAPDEGNAQLASMHCTVTTSTSVNFAGYDVFDTTPLDGTGDVTLECTQVGPSDLVSIEIGRGGARSFATRAMQNGTHRLEYNLYLNAARTILWGDGTGGSETFRARPPTGQPLSVPIFGRIPPGQNVTPGDYSDRLIVTIVY
jgi:spore coat protein U-like protein